MDTFKDIELMAGIAVGQIRADRKKRPTCVYVVTHVYIRQYDNGDYAYRSDGTILHSATEHVETGSRDLDCRSARKMFPKVLASMEVFEEFQEDK